MMTMGQQGGATKVLLDTSVYRRTTLTRSVVVPASVEMGGIETEICLLKLDSVEFNGPRLTDVRALKAICDFARKGGLKFFISMELHQEYLNGTDNARGVEGDLLAGLDVQWVDVPIERSRFSQFGSEAYARKETRIEFCKWLRSFGKRKEKFPILGVSGVPLSEYELESVAELGRFAELCEQMEPNDEKMLDAFHLWTAERAEIPYFLTYDVRFLNFMSQTSRAKLKAEPILPDDLARRMGIEIFEP